MFVCSRVVCRSMIQRGCTLSFLVSVSMLCVQCLHLRGRFSTVFSLLSLVMHSRAVLDVPAKSMCSSIRKLHSTSFCLTHVAVNVLVSSSVVFGVSVSMCPSFCSNVVPFLSLFLAVHRVP